METDAEIQTFALRVVEEVCKQCGNTNGEHRPGCTRRSPKEWFDSSDLKEGSGLKEGEARGLERAADLIQKTNFNAVHT